MNLIFRHPEHGEFRGTRYEFAKAHPELKSCGISQLIPPEARRLYRSPEKCMRRLKSYKGWTCELEV